METTKAQSKKGWDIGIIVIGIFVVIFLILGGESSRLTCKHSRQPRTANCIKQSVLLWLIPLSTTTVNDVSGAQLSESSGYDDGAVYRVELVTPQGITPLINMYTSGYSTKSDVVDQINAYLQSTNGGKLVVTEPGLLSIENFVCMAIWLPIAYLANIIWASIKSGTGGGKNQ